MAERERENLDCLIGARLALVNLRSELNNAEGGASITWRIVLGLWSALHRGLSGNWSTPPASHKAHSFDCVDQT